MITDHSISTLPSARTSLHDRHHLLWTGADFRRVGLAVARNLACTSAHKLDSTVHTVIHIRFMGVLGIANPVTLGDLSRRCRRLIERHESRRCGCYDPGVLVVADAFSLEAFTPNTFDQPNCTGIYVDRAVLDIMRSYYQATYPITDAMRGLFERRCDNGECGCIFQQGGNRLRRAPTWVAA